MSKFIYIKTFFVVLSLSFSLPSFANEEHFNYCKIDNALEAVNHYFNNNVNIICENAKQINNDGSSVKVKFYWQNYKLAMYFDKPINAAVWADKDNIYYLDETINECSKIKTKNSIAKILTSELNLSNKNSNLIIKKYHCNKSDNKFTINFFDKTSPDDGTIEISFEAKFIDKKIEIVNILYLKVIPKDLDQTVMLVMKNQVSTNVDIKPELIIPPKICTK